MEISSIVQNVHFINKWAALWAPMLLIALDFATGYIGACLRKERSSAKMREGGGHKFAELACIFAALIVDCALVLDVKFVYIVSAYIMLMELVSILENAKKMLGGKAPSAMNHTIDHMKDELYDDSVLEIEHSASEDSEDEDDAE